MLNSNLKLNPLLPDADDYVEAILDLVLPKLYNLTDDQNLLQLGFGLFLEHEV